MKFVQAEIEKTLQNEGLEDDDKELAELVLENSKLRHRLAILNKVKE